MTPANRVDECRSARTHHERLGIRRNRRRASASAALASCAAADHSCSVIWSSSPAAAAVFASFLVRSPAAHVQLPVACAQLAVQVNTGACG
jgi:hypothetical protein